MKPKRAAGLIADAVSEEIDRVLLAGLFSGLRETPASEPPAAALAAFHPDEVVSGEIPQALSTTTRQHLLASLPGFVSTGAVEP